MSSSGLHIVKRAAVDSESEQGNRVVLVHGAMDRHNSLRRVARRLTMPVVMYDRRGYAKSIDATPAVRDLERHVADLLEVIGDDPAVVVGHSVGGLIALTAAAHFPASITSVGAFEPPTGWKDWWPDDLCVLSGESAEETVERFYRQMVGHSAWERMSEPIRRELLAEGPALQIDLEAGRREAPFEASDIIAPVHLGHGSESSTHHVRAVRELRHDIAAELTVIEGAAHGAHRSHPDAFAQFVERTAAMMG